MFQGRINRVAERTGMAERLPGWRNWSDKELDQFWEIAGETMELLGYGGPPKREEPIALVVSPQQPFCQGPSDV